MAEEKVCMEKSIGVCIVGCGMISSVHAKAVNDTAGLYLVGAYGDIKTQREEFAEKYAIKAFESLEEALVDDKVQLVSICTPSGTHYDLALRALQAGKHVLVEKPMAFTKAECDTLIQTAKSKGVTVCAVSQLRFSAAATKIKNAIDEGKFGKISLLTLDMKYYRAPTYYSQSGWRGTLKMDGGGALMNQGIHGVDLVCFFMDGAARVSGKIRTAIHDIEVEDTAVASVEFKNGALGTISASSCAIPGSPRRIEICGEKGRVVLEEDAIVDWSVDEDGAQEENGSAYQSFSDPTAIDESGHQRQYADVLAAIRGKKALFYPPERAAHTVSVIENIYKASASGSSVDCE